MPPREPLRPVELIPLERIEAAQDVIAGLALRTPLVRLRGDDDPEAGTEIHLTGSMSWGWIRGSSYMW